MVLIQYIILAFLQHNKDNNTTVNRSQLNNRSQYNFYWLFRNSMGIHYIYKPFSVVMFKIKKNALLKGPGNYSKCRLSPLLFFD